MRADIVTVYHNETNHRQHNDLFQTVARHHPQGGIRLIGVDNRTTNRGFAAACNLGAFHPEAKAPIVGFLNPDAHVTGPFLDQVEATLSDQVVITGCRFGKPDDELKIWGVRDWVCGAAMFVKRSWFASVGGFDQQFVWSHEETDLIRRAENDGLEVRSIELPIEHESPATDSPQDATYKSLHFKQSQRLYRRKWGH